MTKAEYAEYEANVAGFFQTEGLSNLSMKVGTDGDSPEPYFSWGPCDCCGSHLGGDRYDADGYIPATKGIWEGSVCSDCIYYAEYGQLDDMTMLEIEASNA